MSVETRLIAPPASHSTKGGSIAHIARRIFHVSIIIAPFVYYYFLEPLAKPKILRLCILAFIFFVFLFEKLRIRMRLVLFGQRLHEATHISAFAWTMLSLGIVLLLSPSAGYPVAIITTCALVDPLVGEMRLHAVNNKIILLTGILVALAIWLACARIYHFPAWVAVIIAPITAAVEWPTLKWIDDNALMLLVPLVIVFILTAFI